MYNNFFGFRERPFKLVPNPAYLFLSKSHEEAMAHLTYAVTQGDGFVEITGEVGTGKTTLCRAFLDNLDKTVEAAYIFNPKLDSIQLLKAIIDELGLNSAPDTAKELIDILNVFLMEQKAAGRKVIILIDEAQNLSKDVLEQLRLLSNLETTRDKLLQIILVGQPELREILDSYELRQLGQRITLSCQLEPLTLKETSEYITHRTTIASRKPCLIFDPAAIKAIHTYAAGVPRLINIAADRTLLTAYGLNQPTISGKIAKTAIRELSYRSDSRNTIPAFLRSRHIPIAIMIGLVILGIVVLNTGPHTMTNETPTEPLISRPEPAPAPIPDPIPDPEPNPAEAVPPRITPEPQPEPQPPEIAQTPQPVVATAPEPAPVQETAPTEEQEPAAPATAMDLAEVITRLDYRSSRRHALRTALEQWIPEPLIRNELDDIDEDLTFFRLSAGQNRLMMRRISGGLDLVRLLNLPAILELRHPEDSQPRYLTVSRISGDRVTLRARDITVLTTPEALAEYWSEIAYVPWNNFLNITGTVPRNAPEDSVLILKMLLQDLGYRDISMTPQYDEPTRAIIKKLQQKYGIEDDGKVGPLTKITLYRESGAYQMPGILISTKVPMEEMP